LKRVSDELVNAYNYFQFLYVYGLLKYKHITTTKNWKNTKLFDFLNPSLLTNRKNMELIHLEESLKILMNES